MNTKDIIEFYTKAIICNIILSAIVSSITTIIVLRAWWQRASLQDSGQS